MVQRQIKPKVFKIAGAWLWTCNHFAPCGDEFYPEHYRDPWTAAMTTAIKHYVAYHYVSEEMEEFDV